MRGERKREGERERVNGRRERGTIKERLSETDRQTAIY